MKYPFIRAYGQMIGAKAATIQKMVQRAADNQQPDEDLVWMVEGEGFKSLDDLSPTLQRELMDLVQERGGRSDDFILLRDMFGADEIDMDYLGTGKGHPGVTWQQQLCQEYGWDDPQSIEWAARTQTHEGSLAGDRTIVIVQQSTSDGDPQVQTYIMGQDDGRTWVVNAPLPGQIQES